MTPTFLFIMWMCSGPGNAPCPIWQSQKNIVIVEPERDRAACEAQWVETQRIPDPDGFHSVYRCQPVEEDL